MRIIVLSLALVLPLAACGGGALSTKDMEQAAKEKARADLHLAADTPLEAKVWVGQPKDGQTVYCGTVSDTTSGTMVPPQRFAATPEPLRWLVFEPAHEPMIASQPDKYAAWGNLCTGGDRV
jgi:hypothetical protein